MLRWVVSVVVDVAGVVARWRRRETPEEARDRRWREIMDRYGGWID